jgi:hypothetical protein
MGTLSPVYSGLVIPPTHSFDNCGSDPAASARGSDVSNYRHLYYLDRCGELAHPPFCLKVVRITTGECPWFWLFVWIGCLCWRSWSLLVLALSSFGEASLASSFFLPPLLCFGRPRRIVLIVGEEVCCCCQRLRVLVAACQVIVVKLLL